jgi:hypothetical protein
MPKRAVTPVLLVALLAFGGCGSDDAKADTRPHPSPSASPSAPSGVATSPPPRPEGQAQTSQSAVEYASWFAQLVQYALESRDSTVVSAEAFDQGACGSCRSLASFVTDLKQSGFWQVSDDLRVGQLKASERGDVVRVQGSLTYPRIQDLTDDGKVERTIPAKPYSYYVDLSWDRPRGAWRVKDYLFQPRG